MKSLKNMELMVSLPMEDEESHSGKIILAVNDVHKFGQIIIKKVPQIISKLFVSLKRYYNSSTEPPSVASKIFWGQESFGPA